MDQRGITGIQWLKKKKKKAILNSPQGREGSTQPRHLRLFKCLLWSIWYLWLVKFIYWKFLVTHEKLSRWCTRSSQRWHTHTHTQLNTIKLGSVWRPCILLSPLSCVSPHWSSPLPPPPLPPLCLPISLDKNASCFAILNRSNQQCVQQEWIFYALGVRTSESPL